MPRWMTQAFGPGTAASEGRETLIYFSRPANESELDTVLSDFLGQIRINLK